MRSSFIKWFDTYDDELGKGKDIDWFRIIPFILLHLGCLLVLWVGVSPVAILAAVCSYFLRMFCITGFYHRYFSHKSFSTSRTMQFIFAVFGAAATQRGPLWWAAHHRKHHRFVDTEKDPHRPDDGIFWSHMGWFLSKRNFSTDLAGVKDWGRYPELVWLDRFDMVVPLAYALGFYVVGFSLERYFPDLGTTGMQMLVWGYGVSTVVLLHATLLVNSLAHKRGKRTFATDDKSRNNLFVALVTLGEGWHNNHHRYAASVRQGFYWWQIDITYYLLKVFSMVGLVWNLKMVPKEVLKEGRH
tara:strand:- start:1575 stop:2474 length:900 start_codon:yes stop_codon:yes gene_type:complete